jgi:hypothetical protein
MLAELNELRTEIQKANPDDPITLIQQFALDKLDEMEAVTLDDLPTVDPAVVGQLWNDDGTPTVSEG